MAQLADAGARESGRWAARRSGSTLHSWHAVRLALALCGSAGLLWGCGALETPPSACDQIADRKVWVTRVEYLPCAAEILIALDRVRSALDALDAGDSGGEARARAEYQRLETMMRSAGFPTVEETRTLAPQPTYRGFPNEKVVDGGPAVHELNSAIWGAYYFLAPPPHERMPVERDKGRSLHDRARVLHAALR